MGCWNGTCMVTRLPILRGEKVKLTFLYNQKVEYMKKYDEVSVLNKSGIVYSSDMLTPAFFPITGYYNDYGTIENIEEDFNYFIIENVLKCRFGKKIKVDGQEKVDWSLYDVIDGIERSDGYYWSEKKNEWINFDLSFTFIRADIYDFISENILSQLFLSWKYQKYVSLETMLKDSFEQEIAFVKKMKILKDEGDDKEALRLAFSISSNDRIFSKGENGTPFLIDKIVYEEYLYSIIEDDVKTNELFSFWSGYKCLERYLTEARIAWMIQSGSGSQEQSWDLCKMVAEKMISICDEKMYEEENDEWDDD